MTTEKSTNPAYDENAAEFMTREQRLDAIAEILQVLAHRTLTNRHENLD